MKKLTGIIVLLLFVSPLMAQENKEDLKQLQDKVRKLEANDNKLNKELQSTESNVGTWMSSTDQVIGLIDSKILAAQKGQEDLDRVLRQQIIHASGIASLRADQVEKKMQANLLYIGIGAFALLILSSLFYFSNKKRAENNRKELIDYINITTDSLHRNLTEQMESMLDVLRTDLTSEIRKNADRNRIDILNESGKNLEGIRLESRRQEERLLSVIESKIQQVREETILLVPSKKRASI